MIVSDSSLVAIGWRDEPKEVLINYQQTATISRPIEEWLVE